MHRQQFIVMSNWAALNGMKCVEEVRIIDFGITLLFIYSHFCHNFITKLFSVSVYHACKSNTMERSHLCHLVMVAKFLEDNKLKKSLKE